MGDLADVPGTLAAAKAVVLPHPLHKHALFRAVDAVKFPEGEEGASLKSIIRERFVVGEGFEEEEAEEDRDTEPKEHSPLPSLRTAPVEEVMELEERETEKEEAEDERKEVVVQVHDAVEEKDPSHESSIKEEKDEEEHGIFELFPKREGPGSKKESDTHEDTEEATPPHDRINLEVEVLVGATIRRFPAVTDSATAKGPEERWAAILISFTEIEPRDAAPVVRDESPGIAEHHWEGSGRPHRIAVENIFVLR